MARPCYLLAHSSLLMLIPYYVGSIYHHWLGLAFYIVCITSILNYMTGCNETTLLYKIDKVYAHFLVPMTMFCAIQTNYSISLMIYWFCLLFMVVCYKVFDLSNKKNPYSDIWHAVSVHMSGSIGTSFLIYAATSS
jgi:hypothetical protein